VNTDYVEIGRAVLKVLKRAAIDVRAALWEWDTFWQQWELTLVLPLVEEAGIRGAHKRIDPLLAGAGIEPIELSFLTPEAGYAKRLRESLRGMKNRELFRKEIDDGTIIERGYVYFVK
jgi:hypothetical protein